MNMDAWFVLLELSGLALTAAAFITRIIEFVRGDIYPLPRFLFSAIAGGTFGAAVVLATIDGYELGLIVCTALVGLNLWNAHDALGDM